jgi:hypothetical protein
LSAEDVKKRAGLYSAVGEARVLCNEVSSCARNSAVVATAASVVMTETLSEFMTGLGARIGAGPPSSSSLVEAFARQKRVFEEPLFDNLTGFWWGLIIFVGGWFAAWAVNYVILWLWGVNWKRIFGCCSDGGGRYRQDRDRDHRSDEEDPLFRSPNDPNVSTNRPKVVPVVKARFTPDGSVVGGHLMGSSAVSRVADAVGVIPQQYKEVPVVQAQRDSKLWSGMKPSRLENYVRLTALLARLVVLVATIMLAFQAAGVNALSLAASMGIVSLCFTYGGANLVRNFLSVIYMHGTNKFSIGMYIALSDGKQGLITSFGGQWTEVTDDLRPSKGRQVHLIPNGTLMDSDVTVYPDGPPSDVVLRYLEELKTVNEARLAHGLSSLQPVEGAASGYNIY